MNRIKTGIKLQVTPKQSQQVQEICFANGIIWIDDTSKIDLTNKVYLLIYTNIRWCFEHEYYDSSLEEVDASFFIRTQGTCVEEAPKQELKQNINKEETMEKNEVASYADVKEYLIAKGLYEKVLEKDWRYRTHQESFSDLFNWCETEEGVKYWDVLDDELRAFGINKNLESLIQEYRAKQGTEFIEHLEAQPEEVVEVKPKPASYIDVKEYLIAKGLYERVLEIDWETYEEDRFSNLFNWSKTEERHNFWDELNNEMIDLDISGNIKSLVQDYKAKQGKEFIEHIEAQPEEVVEAKPTEQKPKQYLCYVQGKALPKHIHKTLEQAKQEAQRLCRKELAKVSVLEVVAEYEAEVLVKEVL